MKPYTFAIRTSQQTKPKLQKSMYLPTLQTERNEMKTSLQRICAIGTMESWFYIWG